MRRAIVTTTMAMVLLGGCTIRKPAPAALPPPPPETGSTAMPGSVMDPPSAIPVCPGDPRCPKN